MRRRINNQNPKETVIATEQETMEASPVETGIVDVQEIDVPVEIVCGVNGCQTRYTDALVMKRHRERQHGITAELNWNQPLPRNQEIKLA